MQIIVAPEIENNKSLASAVELGNRFFRAIQSEFGDEVSVEWQLPAHTNDASLRLTLRHRPNAEVTAAIPLSVFQDTRELEWRLGKEWQDLLTAIGRYHHNQFCEKLATFDEQAWFDSLLASSPLYKSLNAKLQ